MLGNSGLVLCVYFFSDEDWRAIVALVPSSPGRTLDFLVAGSCVKYVAEQRSENMVANCCAVRCGLTGARTLFQKYGCELLCGSIFVMKRRQNSVSALCSRSCAAPNVRPDMHR